MKPDLRANGCSQPNQRNAYKAKPNPKQPSVTPPPCVTLGGCGHHQSVAAGLVRLVLHGWGLIEPAHQHERRDPARTRLEAPRSAHSGMLPSRAQSDADPVTALNEIRGFLGGCCRTDEIELKADYKGRPLRQSFLGRIIVIEIYRLFARRRVRGQNLSRCITHWASRLWGRSHLRFNKCGTLKGSIWRVTKHKHTLGLPIQSVLEPARVLSLNEI